MPTWIPSTLRRNFGSCLQSQRLHQQDKEIRVIVFAHELQYPNLFANVKIASRVIPGNAEDVNGGVYRMLFHLKKYFPPAPSDKYHEHLMQYLLGNHDDELRYQLAKEIITSCFRQ